MDEMLKPCPFCGGDVSFLRNLDGEIRAIRCRACRYGLSFTGFQEPKKSETFGETMSRWEQAWNRRTPERATGRWGWILGTHYGHTVIDEFTCSECGKRSDDSFNFCPHCGAKMEEDEP